MNAEQLARIFRPYAQADQLTSHVYGGTGLGLVITKQLAELMGGSIAVESAPGTGATFTLRLPQTAASAWDAHDWRRAAAGD